MTATKQIASEYLRRGDIQQIAQAIGVVPLTVSRVRDGKSDNPTVLRALYEKIMERKREREDAKQLEKQLQEALQNPCQSRLIAK